MKRIVTTAVAILLISTASAQVLFSENFEKGTLERWMPWQNRTDQIKIVEGAKAKNSQYAMSYRTGVFTDFKGVKEGVTYRVTFDSNIVLGEQPGTVRLNFYNPEIKKMITLTSFEIPAEKGFQRVEFTFTSKITGGSRLVFVPNNTGSGAEFIVDNIKIEQVE